MSTIGAGHPDFTRENLWASSPLVNVNEAISADKDFDLGYVGGFEMLEVFLLPGNNLVGWRVRLFSWMNQAESINLTNGTLSTRNGIAIQHSFTVRGPFMSLTVHASDYTVPRPYQLIVVPRSGRFSPGGVSGDGIIHSATAFPIANGQTFVFTPNSVTGGNATWIVNPGAGPWFGIIRAFNEANQYIAPAASWIDTTGARVNIGFRLPPRYCTMEIQNNSGAAANFDAAVILEQ